MRKIIFVFGVFLLIVGLIPLGFAGNASHSNFNISDKNANSIVAMGGISNKNTTMINQAKVIQQNYNLYLNNSSKLYVYGEVNGGNGYQSNLSTGNITRAVTASGNTGVQFSYSKSNSTSVSNSPSIGLAIGGFSVSGYSNFTAKYGFNNNSRANGSVYTGDTVAYDNFTLVKSSFVVFMAAASSQHYISVDGIKGITVECNGSMNLSQEGQSNVAFPFFIGYALLGPGSYGVVETSYPITGGQTHSNMADLIGAYIFQNNTSISGKPLVNSTELYATIGIVATVIAIGTVLTFIRKKN